MAIPNGTKFHGVAPNVETQNKGSQLSNSDRDVYTFPNDFDLATYTYAGTIGNFGFTANPFQGDTVEWSGITFPQDQTSVLMFPEAVQITSVFFKACSSLGAASPDFNYVFNFYTSNDLTADPGQPATWTQAGSLVTELTDGSMPTPGFIEDVAASQKLIVPQGSMLAMAGITLAGSITQTNQVECVIGLVAKSVTV